MRYILLFFIFFSSFSGMSQVRNQQFKAWLDSAYKHSIPLITVSEMKDLAKENVFILDAREGEEYDVSHIKNAMHTGYFWFDMRKLYDIPKDAFIVLYCTSGTRAEKIGEKLERAGYKNVYNLYGGIVEWINEGQPVYKTNGVQTSEIHTYNAELAQWVERGAKVH
ncbi:MAG TPA: rhodanese-like domain-containing protein [Sphingobacteriaceae bacterium]